MEFDEGMLRSKRSMAGGDGDIDQNRHFSSRKRQGPDRYSEERKSSDGEREDRYLDHDRGSAMEQSSPSWSEQRCDDRKDGDVDVSFANETVATGVTPTAGPLLSDQAPTLGSGHRPPLLVATELEEATSECVVLKNMFDGAVEKSPDFYLEIKESVHESCAQFGPVFHIHVDKNLGSVYLRFNSKWASRRALKAFHNSIFEGRVITATFMSNSLYDTMFPEYWAELLG